MISLPSSVAQRALLQRDLTDPAAGPHALQQLIADVHTSLASAWHCRRQLHRGAAICSTLVDSPSNKARLLPAQLQLRPNMRTHLTELLAAQSLDPPEDMLLVAPGMVYRRSPISPLHVSEPHQLDLWRLRRGRLSSIELAEMVRLTLAEILPGRRYRLLPSARTHLTHSMQLDIDSEGGWIPIGRIGLLAPAVLASAGLDPESVTALGMTLGLDRVLMLRKGIPHIRLLRSSIPAIAEQMLDLAPYRPSQPRPTQTCELSLTDHHLDELDLADRIRLLLPDRLDSIEQVQRLPQGRLRLTLRHPERALQQAEADAIRDAVAELVAAPAAARQAANA